jgi:hypothetical protein
MKRTTLLLVGLLATAVPLTSAIAGPGFGGGPIPGVPGNPEFMIERMADHLDLTDDQRVSIGNILERQSEAQGRDGRSIASSGEAALQRGEGGSGNFSRSGSTIATGSDGGVRTAESSRESNWSKNEAGGRDFSTSRNGR